MADVVTLQEMKDHLRVDFDDEDDLIAAKVAAAISHVQNVAGIRFADLDEAPEALREAVKLYAAHLYEHREPTIVGETMTLSPMGFDDLVRPYREAWF